MANTEVAITMPFSIDSFGRVGKTDSQEKIWADRVAAAIGTVQYTRIMRPSFGSDIASTEFELYEDTSDIIQQLVERAFEQHLTLLELQDVVVTGSPEAGTIAAEIIYELPNGKTVSTAVGVAQLLGDELLTEELL